MSIDIHSEIEKAKAEVEKARRRLEKLEMLAAIETESDPDLVIIARALFSPRASKSPVVTMQVKEKEVPIKGIAIPSLTLFDRVVAWFAENKVEAATIKQMSMAMEVSPSSVRQMIYTSNRDWFEKTGTTANGRESLFRFKYNK